MNSKTGTTRRSTDTRNSIKSTRKSQKCRGWIDGGAEFSAVSNRKKFLGRLQWFIIEQTRMAVRTSMEVSRVLYESRHAFNLKMIWTQDLDHVATIDAHPVNVYSLAVLGDTLYSCSNDGTLKAWNWGTWDLKKTILEKQQNDIIKVYTDDDKLYASNDQGEVSRVGKGPILVLDDGFGKIDDHEDSAVVRVKSLTCAWIGINTELHEQLTASYYLHEDIADLLIIGSLVFNARNVDVSVTEMMGRTSSFTNPVKINPHSSKPNDQSVVRKILFFLTSPM
ncbi:unnamed protein product [Nesidiocoris tenuis]|uniref:Uncharacterized protein n=1 Tax=Nesidiocoris tenuis TaxID=355587 RepID=A0A6H5HEG3_9HEMI|nr:unnamed protein product [Nesidiocoris tenuis]